jgi:hypothetical protein
MYPLIIVMVYTNEHTESEQEPCEMGHTGDMDKCSAMGEEQDSTPLPDDPLPPLPDDPLPPLPDNIPNMNEWNWYINGEGLDPNSGWTRISESTGLYSMNMPCNFPVNGKAMLALAHQSQKPEFEGIDVTMLIRETMGDSNVFSINTGKINDWFGEDVAPGFQKAIYINAGNCNEGEHNNPINPFGLPGFKSKTYVPQSVRTTLDLLFINNFELELQPGSIPSQVIYAHRDNMLVITMNPKNPEILYVQQPNLNGELNKHVMFIWNSNTQLYHGFMEGSMGSITPLV